MGRRDPEARAEYAALYRLTERGAAARKAAQVRYRGSDKWRESHRRAVAAYRARSADRRAAHYALTEAIATGRLVPPLSCVSCGTVGPTVGHHARGYSGDSKLDVDWLCQTCHRAIHPLGRPKKVRPLLADLSDIE